MRPTMSPLGHDDDNGAVALTDPAFVDGLIAAVSQKPKRMSRARLSPIEKVERRRLQRRVQRHSPIAIKRETVRRQNRAMQRRALEFRWLEHELIWRALLVHGIKVAVTRDDLQYLVGALIASDRAVARCRNDFWPAASKDMLNQIPEWFVLVPPEIRARYHSDIAGSNDACGQVAA